MRIVRVNTLSVFTGKTANAVSVAKYYNAACLNIDSIVLEAISDSNNISGIRARELCIRAAIEQSMREAEESGKPPFSMVYSVCGCGCVCVCVHSHIIIIDPTSLPISEFPWFLGLVLVSILPVNSHQIPKAHFREDFPKSPFVRTF